MEYTHTLSEGAGCLGLAALLYGKIKVKPNEKVCVVICGGNIDMSTLRQTYAYSCQLVSACMCYVCEFAVPMDARECVCCGKV